MTDTKAAATDVDEIARKLLREKRRKERAERERLAQIEEKEKFEAQRDAFHRNVAYWSENFEETPTETMLRIYCGFLHHRIVWKATDALHWSEDKDGDFRVNCDAIDYLHPSMKLVLGLAKAQHKIEHDREMRELRTQAQRARLGAPAKTDDSKNVPESDEQAHAPGASA